MRPATPGARAGSLSGDGCSSKALRRLRVGGRRRGRACRAAARVSAPCSASERLAGRPAMPASTRFHTCRGRRRAPVGALRGRRRAVRMHAVRASLRMRAAAPCAAAPSVHVSALAASCRCVRGGVRSAGQARGGHAPGCSLSARSAFACCGQIMQGRAKRAEGAGGLVLRAWPVTPRRTVEWCQSIAASTHARRCASAGSQLSAACPARPRTSGNAHSAPARSALECVVGPTRAACLSGGGEVPQDGRALGQLEPAVLRQRRAARAHALSAA